ncbi:protein rolling stone-like [Lytechinus pictus]|uniref:protein rolling stone-like n=1 Tax=Lytechinus pictus TaxID=7653 RepID=UPI0030BA091E
MGCLETLKQEFRCRAFLLGGTKSNLFVTPQGRWLGMPWTFMIYRLAIAIYQLVFVILTLVYWGREPLYSTVDTKAKWLIYISNWTYLFVLAYFIIAAINTFYWHLGHEKKGHVDKSGEKIEMSNANTTDVEIALPSGGDESTPWYLQLQRFCQVYSCAASVFVTILFYALVYDSSSTVIHVFNVHVHGIAMVLMFIDTILVATPIRILHMVYVMLVAFIYFCFTAIYYAAGGRNPSGGTYIYSGSLDWKAKASRSAVIAVLTVLVAAPVLHLIFYGIYRIRLAIGSFCQCYTHHDSEISTSSD